MAGKNGHKTYEIADALSIITDDDMRAALVDRKAELKKRLASFVLNAQMPGWESNSDEGRTTQQAVNTLCAAIEVIDGRLSGASELLKAYGTAG